MKNHAKWIATATLIAALGWTASARAAFVQATFNDLTGGGANTVGQAGGTGFTGNWTGSDTIDVVAGDLTAPIATNFALTQSGTAQRVVGDFNAGGDRRRVNRVLTTALIGDIWFSFLVQPQGESSRGGIDFNNSDTSFGTPGSVNARILVANGDLFVALGVSNVLTTNNNLFTFGQTGLVLGHLVIDGNGVNDVLSLWVNPDVENLGAADFFKDDLHWVTASMISNISVESYQFNNGTNGGGFVDLLTLSNNANAYGEVTGFVAIPAPAALPAGLMLIVLTIARRRRVG